MNVNWRKSTNDSEGRGNRNFTRLLELPFDLVGVFKEASRKLHLFFCLTRRVKNLKTICACKNNKGLINRPAKNILIP
jgi:hypothetical protein